MQRLNLGKILLAASIVMALTPCVGIAEPTQPEQPQQKSQHKHKRKYKRKDQNQQQNENTNLKDVPDPIDLNSD